MKKILLVLATLLVSAPIIGQSQTNEITDSFTDKVKAIKEEEKEITILFARHSSVYKMAKTNPRYEELKTKLEKLKKEEKKVKVVAILPTMEIKDVTE